MSNIVDFIEPYDAYTCDIYTMVCGFEAYVQDMIYEECHMSSKSKCRTYDVCHDQQCTMQYIICHTVMIASQLTIYIIKFTL